MYHDDSWASKEIIHRNAEARCIESQKSCGTFTLNIFIILL